MQIGAASRSNGPINALLGAILRVLFIGLGLALAAVFQIRPLPHAADLPTASSFPVQPQGGGSRLPSTSAAATALHLEQISRPATIMLASVAPSEPLVPTGTTRPSMPMGPGPSSRDGPAMRAPSSIDTTGSPLKGALDGSQKAVAVRSAPSAAVVPEPLIRRTDLNAASVRELNQLRGGGMIGRAILRGRPYKSVDDLVRKRVLTRSTFRRIADQVAVR